MLCSHQQRLRVSVSPYPPQTLNFFSLLKHFKYIIESHSGFICISLIGNVNEDFCVCLLKTFMYLWWNIFSSLAHLLKIGLSSYSWGQRIVICWIQFPYHVYDLQIFSPILRLVFYLSYICSVIWWSLIFPFFKKKINFVSVVLFKKSSKVTKFFPMASSRSLVLSVPIQTMTHLSYYFCMLWGTGLYLIYCMWISSCISTIC